MAALHSEEQVCRMSSNDSRAIDILRDLVAIPSVNPAYDPVSSGEIEMARYIERWADRIGLCVTRQPVLNNRHNVIAQLMINQAYPILLFESHMDTVGINPGTRAGLAPLIDGERMYGRGTCDTKGSMAAMMTAIEELVAVRNELACNIEYLAAVDEETGGSGSLTYARNRPDIAAAIVGEPTGNRIVNAHRGVVRGRIVVRGHAAHTSVAHEGINAIDAMADVIVSLRAISRELESGPGGGSLTVSLIEGGSGINIVPENCSIAYDRRTVPGDSRGSVLGEIDAALDSIRIEWPDVSIERPDPDLDVAPLDTSLDERIVIAASAAAAEVGLDPAPTSVPYGSDASYLHDEASIPCIVFGPGSIEVAHSADEYVPLAELTAAAQFFTQVALSFGQPHAVA
jgi:acetylornithine deacetylase